MPAKPLPSLKGEIGDRRQGCLCSLRGRTEMTSIINSDFKVSSPCHLLGTQSSRLPLRVPLRKRHLRLDPSSSSSLLACMQSKIVWSMELSARGGGAPYSLPLPSDGRKEAARASGSCSIRAFRDSLYSNDDVDDDSVCNHDSIKGLFPRNTTTISIKRGGDFNACKVVVMSGGSHT